MTPAELIARAAAQPVVSVTREVSVWGPTLQAAVQARPYMTIAQLQAHPDQHKEQRQFRYGHVLGPGLAPAEIAAWQRGFAQHRLPGDLVDALALVDGVHLWADLADGRAYFGIAPLREWRNFAELGWRLDRPSPQLAISYHDNNDYCLVLDTATSRYEWFDVEELYNPLTVGTSFAQTLDWFWDYAQWLDPTRS